MEIAYIVLLSRWHGRNYISNREEAEEVWIKTLGYDRADAILLSKYQSFALVELALGCPTLLLLLGNSVNRQ